MTKPANQQERHHAFPNFWQAVGIVALLLATQLLIAIAFHEAGLQFSAGDPGGSVIQVLACGLAFSILLSYKQIGYRQLFSPSGLSFTRAAGSLALPVTVLAGGSVFLAVEIENLLMQAVPMSEVEGEAFARLVSSGVSSFIALCLVAPFIEEMLFRGIFLRSFLRNHAPWRAILLSALLFGLMHLNLYQFVVATIIGVFFGWLYHVTRSLWPSILAHAIYNGGGLLYVWFYPQSVEYIAPGSFPAHPVPLLLLAILAFAYGLRWVRREAPRVQDNAT